MINQFTGEYRFLSNFYPSTARWGGRYYPTSEHAYQAAKTLEASKRDKIAAASTPGEAKRLGRALVLRPDWFDIRDDVMYQIVKDKFQANFILRTKLLNTNDEELVEGNTWNDTYWGVNLTTGVGQNKLGKILMQVREELRGN